MTLESIGQITLVLHLTGGLLAIFLYYGLGKIFWIPMTIDYVYYHVAGLFVDFDIGTVSSFIAFSVFDVFTFLWVIYLSGVLRNRWAIYFIFLLVMFASFLGIGGVFLYERIGDQRFAELIGYPRYAGDGGQMWFMIQTSSFYVWKSCTFLVIMVMIIGNTLWKWLRGQAATLMLDPRKRVLIPLAITTGIQGLSQGLLGHIPDVIFYSRINIVGSLLGWGWVAMELPFYLMYRRMLKADVTLRRG